MTDPSTQSATTLEAVRAAIDAVDDELLALLLKRAGLSAALATVKPLGARETPLRPAREVRLLRRLLAKAGGEADLAFDVWRAIMAASVRRQRPIEIFTGGGAEATRLYDIARRHFGATVRITRTEDARTAITRASETTAAVALAPFPSHSGPGVWWPLLSESRFHSVSLIAALPLRAESGEPEAAVLAVDAPLEPAGEDQTLALAFDPHHRLQRALSEAGLPGRELARARTSVLIGFDGFVPANDMRLGAMGRVGMDGVRVIGAYARV